MERKWQCCNIMLYHTMPLSHSSWSFSFGIPSVDMAVDHRVVIFHNVYTVEHINGKHKSSDPRDWVKLLLLLLLL